LRFLRVVGNYEGWPGYQPIEKIRGGGGGGGGGRGEGGGRMEIAL